MAKTSTSGVSLLCAGLLAVLALIAVIWIAVSPSSTSPTSTSRSTATTKPSPSSPDELVIAVEDAATPWSQPDGTGCANDIVAASYQAVSVPIKWTVAPYARAKAMVMNGQVVACVAMSWAPELEGKVVFADADKPLYIFTATYARNLEVPLKATDEKSIPAGTKIGTVINYEYPDSVNALADQGVIFEPTNNEEMNLKKLALGRIDLVIINTDSLKTADRIFARAGVTGQVGVAFSSGSMASHIGFCVAHPQAQFARTKFNEGYDIIRKNGTLDKIHVQWRDK